MKSLLLVLLAAGSTSSVAPGPNGAALYKSECASCHGAAGEGSLAPALRSTKLTQRQIADLLTKGAAGKGGPHSTAISGLTRDQAAAIAAYVETLKK